MPREATVVALVLVCGYGLYVVGGMAVGPLLAADDPESPANVTGDIGLEPEAETDTTSFSFRPAADAAGVDYAGVDTYRGTKGVMSNAGVYTSDVDGDGWHDLLLLGGAEPRLLRNEQDQFREAPLPTPNGSVRSALFFDFDADGDDDLLLLSAGRPPMLLENDDGRFSRTDAGFQRNLSVPIGATAGDHDGDGCLDLYVIQNGDWLADHPEGERDYDVSPTADNGSPNYLYDGDCTAFDRTGVGTADTTWSLATSFVDLNGDGRPDIHVANDFNHDLVYLNRGNGSFRRRVLHDRTNRNGMSSEVGDLNGDGRPDLYVTNIYYPVDVNRQVNTTNSIRASGNNALLGRENGSFAEAAERLGARIGGWGWAASLADFDNDGDRDLVTATREVTFEVPVGRFSDAERARLHSQFPSYQYPALWRSNGSGFERRSQTGAGLRQSNGRGIATLDYDRDGALEIVVANATGPYRVYEERRVRHDAIQIDLRRDGAVLGSEVRVRAGGERHVRFTTAGSDFLSQEPRTVHVGVGNASRASVTVVWPDGDRTVIDAVATGQRLVVTPDGVSSSSPFRPDDR